MKLNTNSNVYTIVYSIVVVVIVAFLLAFCYSALKSRSEANERIQGGTDHLRSGVQDQPGQHGETPCWSGWS